VVLPWKFSEIKPQVEHVPAFSLPDYRRIEVYQK